MITGFNGVGKSTLLKTLVGQIPSMHGHYKFSDQVTIGYFEQDLIWEDTARTPIQIVSDSYPDMVMKEVCKALALCGISSKHAMQPVGTLSGGEQTKVKMCLLCLDVTDDTKIIPCTTAFSTLHSLFILFTHSTRCTKYSSQSVGNADKSRNNTCPAFVSFKWIINEVLYVIFHPLWPQQSPAGTPAQIRHTWYR